MLSIGKLAAGQERYYLDHAAERVDVVESVAGGADDYYLDPTEARGRWIGAGASRLGLVGDVGAEQLRRVLAGLAPATGEPLRQTNGRLSVSGYDLTFSAPKSVSVIFALGGEAVRQAARDAHDLAVREAVGYLERTAAGVRRGHGGTLLMPADGLVAATFRHRTSRAADPQLHTHVVVANLARGSDGRWSTLDGRRIYAQARAASFIYQAVLRGELSAALGLRWNEVEAGIADVDGVPEELLRAFSTRRAEIEASLADHGVSGARAAEAAALATRKNKDRSVSSTDLLAKWREQAAELGWSEERIAGLCHQGRALGLEDADWEQIVHDLVSPTGLTLRRSSFARSHVVQAIAERVPAGMQVTARGLELLAERFLSSPEVVPLVGDALEDPKVGFRRQDGRVVPVALQEHRYSTVELLGVEQALLQAVEEADNAGVAIVPDAQLDSAIAARPTLAPEQEAMVRGVCSGGEGVVVVAGIAGTGKTFALDAAREAWQQAGNIVLGAAVARRAARELESGAGIPSTSVHALIGRLAAGAQITKGSVLVVDEAGMLGTRQMAALADHVLASEAKLVLVGDHRQLPELEAGGAFRALARRPTTLRLTENRRQVEDWERTALEQLRVGRAAEALQAYEDHQRVATFATPDEAREGVVRDWWGAGARDGSVMIAQRRLDVADLNRRALEYMRANGRLADEELAVAGARFAVGDRVVVRRNDASRGVYNGDLGRVIDVDRERLRISIEVASRDSVVVLDSKFLLTRTEHGHPSLVHGYAITGHVAQGTTVSESFVLAGPGISQEWAYSAMSRGREANRLYAALDSSGARSDFAPRDVHAGARDAREALIKALETSEAQPLALDRGWPGHHRRTGIARAGREAEIG